MKKSIVLKVLLPLTIIVIFLTVFYNLIDNNESVIKERVIKVISDLEYSHLKENEDVKVTSFDNVNVYHKNENDEVLTTIKESIGDLEKYFEPVFGKENSNLDIVLFESYSSFNREFNYDSDVTEKQGIYLSDTIYMPVEEWIDEYVLWHEYTHYRFDKFCASNEINYFSIPVWFNEGLSEYTAYSLYDPYEDYIEYKDIPVSKLDSIINGDSEDVEYAYFKSYKLVDKIIELKGEKVIQNILMDTKELDFYLSLEKNIGMDIKKLESLLK